MFFCHFAHQLAQIVSGSLHLELIIGALETVGMSTTSAIDVGQGVDETLDIHPFFETLLGNIGLVEQLSGCKLVAVEADEDIAGLALFAVGTATFVPVVTAATALDREAKVSPAFVWG